MASNILDEYNQLKIKAISRDGELRASRRSLSESTELLKTAQTNLAFSKNQFSIHVKANEVLKSIIEQKSQEHLNRITKLLTHALQIVFTNRKYAVEIDVEDKRNANSATFQLLEEIDGVVIKSPLADSTGGSIRSVIGFVLQIYYIRYFKLAPVIYMDESFFSIAEPHLPSLVNFMRELSTLRDFIFVLITHDNRIIPLADKTYLVENGTVREIHKGADN